jgi:hypothetical protein
MIALDGVNTAIPGGWIDKNWKQLGLQLAYIVACCAYVFVVTAALAKGLDLLGLRLRMTPEEERLGMDEVEVSHTLSVHCFFSPTNILFCRSESLPMIILRSVAISWMACDLSIHKPRDQWLRGIATVILM